MEVTAHLYSHVSPFQPPAPAGAPPPALADAQLLAEAAAPPKRGVALLCVTWRWDRNLEFVSRFSWRHCHCTLFPAGQHFAGCLRLYLAVIFRPISVPKTACGTDSENEWANMMFIHCLMSWARI